jgi:uncharacterized protein (TIGR02757 family)
MTEILSTNKTLNLKRELDALVRAFDASFLSTDPLHFVHGYKRDRDREIVGLIASCLAYGRVDGIKKSVGRVLGAMGKSPYEFTLNFNPAEGLRLFDGFVHRFSGPREITCLIYFAKQMLKESGSIGGFFMKGFAAGDESIKAALSAFSENALSLDSFPIYGAKKLPQKAGVRFFFPNPNDKSACKRLNLYLRWMVRRGDLLDFGIWKKVNPAQLVIPLDTHIARISKNIGLTTLRSPGWSMAEEITSALRKLNPKDPVRYDFALCRLGILDRCPKKKDALKCEKCLIRKVCVL